LINDKVEEILNRPYNQEGVLNNNKIYIPKKGDKVKLDKVVVIDKIFGQTTDGTLVGQVDCESYYDGKGFKLEEKKLKRITTIKIDFSYPRFFSEDNIYPLSDELKKTTVEDNLVKLINKLIDYEITINDIKYEYFEFTTQEFVGNFYKFQR